MTLALVILLTSGATTKAQNTDVDTTFTATQNPFVEYKFLGDPAALVDGDRLYIYAGHDEAPVGQERYVMKEWCILSTSDMNTWTEHTHKLKAKDFPWAKGDAWASQVISRNGKYYWYVTAEHKHHRGKAIGVAVADKPTGPFIPTKEALITNDMTTEWTDIPWDDIDPTVFIDDDGQAWMFWGNRQLYRIRLKENMVETEGKLEVVDIPAIRMPSNKTKSRTSYTEAPWLHKYNGWYYLTFSVEFPEKTAYAMSRSINGPWEYKGVINEIAGNSNTNHHSIVFFKGHWYFIYHNGGINTHGSSYHRSLCIDRLYYKENGEIQLIDMTTEGIWKKEYQPYASILTYSQAGGTERLSSFYLAASTDGKNYTELNHGKPVVYPLKGTKKIYSPILFRKADGKFGLMAADSKGKNILLFSSSDLVNYDDERYLLLNKQDGKISRLTCEYDCQRHGYVIGWSDDKGRTFESFTTDFKTIGEAKPANINFPAEVKGNLPKNSIQPSTLCVTESECDKVLKKYAQIVNTGVRPFAPLVVKQGEKVVLPSMAVGEYSDGSTQNFGVKWNADELASLAGKGPGKYVVHGELQQPEYPSPLIRERADPNVFKGSDGYYYFTASYPMYRSDDPNGYDRVILRRATSIAGLAEAKEICIWHEKNSKESYRWVWAPEIRQVEGTWYVFFTTAISKDVWSIRPRVIACIKGDRDPFNPKNWEEVGHLMQPADGDKYSFTHFSLDMTHFEVNGRHYVVWAEKPNTSDILIAEVDGKQPWIAKSKYTLLTKPEYAWEHDGNTWVNEGPAVIRNNGKVYLAFSASAVNHTYCVGLLSADENADLLDVNSWEKLRYPILSTEDLPTDQNGPGHNSFTTDEYGNPVIVYHARNPKETIDGGLFDPGRHAFAKTVHFAADGMPVMNLTREQELDPRNKNVVIKVEVK